VAFALLWSSASVAGKFGLQSSEPLTLFTVRFLIAGIILIGYSRLAEKERWPSRDEWVPLCVFGLFNTALYLGIFIIALREVTAGISALSLALNPVLISILSALWLRRAPKGYEWLSIAIGLAGVVLAVSPLLADGLATMRGFLLLLLSMLMYSIGAVYYARITWTLTRAAINGWQVLLGGLMLLPLTILFEGGGTTYDLRFWLSEFWLIVPVSIGAVQLWLRLLKADPVKASLWLFLCPVFGLAYSAVLLGEPLSWHTGAGTVLVIVALWLGQRGR
jgi:drug/metabolite transporter (DMT)-like permease